MYSAVRQHLLYLLAVCARNHQLEAQKEKEVLAEERGGREKKGGEETTTIRGA